MFFFFITLLSNQLTSLLSSEAINALVQRKYRQFRMYWSLVEKKICIDSLAMLISHHISRHLAMASCNDIGWHLHFLFRNLVLFIYWSISIPEQQFLYIFLFNITNCTYYWNILSTQLLIPGAGRGEGGVTCGNWAWEKVNRLFQIIWVVFDSRVSALKSLW